jgi:hypothetical protein
MVLTPQQATTEVGTLRETARKEKTRLDRIRRYLRDDPNERPGWLPSGTPTEVQRLAKLSRVNMLKFVLNSRVQSMYVDGFRTPDANDHPAWRVWQINKMDARQIGVHRAALSYGAGYVTVLPGEPAPVMRGVSPRKLTAVYGDDDDWPVFALEERRTGWRLYDSEAVYTFQGNSDQLEWDSTMLHGAAFMGEPVTPVVRYTDTFDLDDRARGIVEPYIPLQDQINVTTFGLLVSQHFGAFKQRYIIGWLAESEEQKLKMSASKMWTFDDENIKVDQLDEADLTGYIKSRESTLKHLATVSQTPAHELIGEMVNISAEALVAAEASKQRALDENRTVAGEAHEQALGLASEYQGLVADPMAYVLWRGSEARSLAQVVDALGKAVQMLGIPPQALWDRVAEAMGVSQQEVESWKELAANDPLTGLAGLLGGQAAA